MAIPTTTSPNPVPLTTNTIAIQRGLVLISASSGDNRRIAASLQAELMNLGFMLDTTAFEAASKASREWLVGYHNEIIPYLRKRLGADKGYQPFYRNFPTQVMEMSNLELFVNAIIHYWSNGRWEPPQVLRERGFAFENTKFRIVTLGTDKDLMQVFTKLVSINQSLTEQDKETVAWLIDNYKGALAIPASIPFKETLCILAAKGLDVSVKTPTDVLRIAVFMSGGDISLPGVPKATLGPTGPGRMQWFFDNLKTAELQAREKFKFKKFSRGDRRRLLAFLEMTNLDVTEMQRHLGRWLRLGEILHVGEHAARFPRCAEAFRRLRNQPKGSKIRTFNAEVDLAFKESWHKGVALLATRPGEFARRLDWMLRQFDSAYVLQAFARVGTDVSSKVLFELFHHFGERMKPGAPRSVMLKGKRSKMKSLPPLPAMDADLVHQVGNIALGIIKDRIGHLPPLGKVWIDERLKQVPVPFAMRSINTAVKTYVRGTRIPYRSDAKVIRPFIHWYDEEGNQDLDLSAGFYSESLNQISHVSFTNLKDARLNCCHSGTFAIGKAHAQEYVDIDIQQCLTEGVRYVIIQAFNYNARPMHTVKECVFGLMERESAVANEIFVPKTITNCMALANEGTSVSVCIIDLRDGNYIWADVESERVLPTLENTAGKSAELLKTLIRSPKMSIYELLMLHVQMRGTLVTSVASADVAFKWDELVTEYAKVAAYMNV